MEPLLSDLQGPVTSLLWGCPGHCTRLSSMPGPHPPPELKKQTIPESLRRGTNPLGSSLETAFPQGTSVQCLPGARPSEPRTHCISWKCHCSGIGRLALVPSALGPSTPQHSPGAAYGAVGCTGAHFVPSGAPAHLEDAASDSVAVNEIPSLQSKVITP